MCVSIHGVSGQTTLTDVKRCLNDSRCLLSVAVVVHVYRINKKSSPPHQHPPQVHILPFHCLDSHLCLPHLLHQVPAPLYCCSPALPEKLEEPLRSSDFLQCRKLSFTSSDRAVHASNEFVVHCHVLRHTEDGICDRVGDVVMWHSAGTHHRLRQVVQTHTWTWAFLAI